MVVREVHTSKRTRHGRRDVRGGLGKGVETSGRDLMKNSFELVIGGNLQHLKRRHHGTQEDL